MRKTQARRLMNAREMKHFIAIVGIIVGSFLLVVSIGVFAYVQTVAADSEPVVSTAAVEEGVVPAAVPEESKGGFVANLLLPPEKTNFIVAGMDEGEALTDVILAGSFDRETQKISLISIPRDTKITMSKEDIKALNDVGRYPPSHGVMKINSINAYGGKVYGIEYLKKYLGEILDVEFDYYALVNLKAFRNIVSAVGGVSMDIPSGGLYYNDPEQNLTIRVPGGRQLLDGEMAEGVVRYRATYRGGDLQRIGVQQEFMKEFFAQALTKDTIMKNAGSFLTTLISYVRTDFGIQDIPLYLRYVSSLKAENMSIMTLPGDSDYQGEASYFFYDKEKTAELAREIFHEKSTSGLTGLHVQLLNGAGVPELLDTVKGRLEASGINVTAGGEYTGSQKPYTRIVVRESGTAEGFMPYFNSISEELDSDGIPEGFDVVIIIGSAEPDA